MSDPPDWMHFCLVTGFVFRLAAYENIGQGFIVLLENSGTMCTLQSDSTLC